VNTPVGKFSEKVREVSRLRKFLAQSSFSPEDILNEGHRRFIMGAAEELGLVGRDLIGQLAKQDCDLNGFDKTTLEQVYEAVAARIFRLDKDVEEARARRQETEGGGEQLTPRGPDLAAGAAGDPGPSVAATAGGRAPPEEPGGP
jgi:hypothetical protein